jgi:hypothetical protein
MASVPPQTFGKLPYKLSLASTTEATVVAVVDASVVDAGDKYF